MKILIADDSRVMRQIVTRTLRQAGYTGHTIIEAADGAAALDAVRAEGPDLVLSDWNMPGVSGIELLQRLRGAGNQVTFGFVTSERSLEMRERAHAAGAEFVIGKPFTADDFRDVLSPVLPATPPAPIETTLPTNKAVRDLFETLLGRDVTVVPCAPVEIGPADPTHMAAYVDDAMRMAAAAVSDLPLAIRCASALALMPRPDAAAVQAARQLTDDARSTMDEVLNIVATLFNLPGAPHVRLDRTYPPGGAVPTDVTSAARTLGRRLDLSVDIAGYGAGRLSLVLAT